MAAKKPPRAPAAPAKPSFDRASLRALIRTLEAKQVHEFEYEDATFRVRIVRGTPVVAPAPIAAPAFPAAPSAAVASAAAPDESDVVYVTSPFVGTFYRAPSPDAPTFVEVGSVVRQGQALCIIEAIKLMNEIESDTSGTVLEVVAENGKPVEFGQKLFKIKKT